MNFQLNNYIYLNTKIVFFTLQTNLNLNSYLYSYLLTSVWFLGGELGGVCIEGAIVPISSGVVMVTRSLLSLSGGVRDPGIID